MTCVIAVRDSACLAMGADSCGVDFKSGEIYTVERPRKIIRRDPYLIGYTASFRIGQALRLAEFPELPPECDLYDHMVSRFLPAAAGALQQDRDQIGELLVKDGNVSFESRGCLIVAVTGRIFGISADFSILEIGDCIAIGCGRSYAYGALHALGTESTPEDRVRKALEAAAAYSPGVRGPFHIETLTSPPEPTLSPPLISHQDGRRNYKHGG